MSQNNKKSIIIIGGGVAGLSAGVYGRMNDFDTEIYEMHTIPGGECTGWKRKDYYFDGCIHWLIGSKDKTSTNRIWRETGALDDSVKIINHDFFYSYEEDGKTVYMYTDIKRLESHLKEMAPEDTDRITYLCKAIEAFKSMDMPDKPFDLMKGLDMVKMMAKMFPTMKYMPKFDKITIKEYAESFKSPLLQKALLMLIPGHFKATALVSTFASLAAGDAGWPEGGSLAFAKRMEAKYRALGGKIFYKSRVEKILIENNRARGIRLTDGTERFADYVISTTDGHEAIFDLLEGRYLDDKARTMYSDSEAYPVYTTVMVSLGINADLSKYPQSRFFKTPNAVDGGGKNNEHIGFRHLCYDKTLMPEGKSALITVLQTDFNWWNARYDDKEKYIGEKDRIGEEIKSIAEKYYPEAAGKVEVVDVATPMTYVRYCNAWKGAWMAWAMAPEGTIRFLPGKLPGLDGFVLAGQWTMPPGGLPVAVVSGKGAIQRICKQEGRKFTIAE